MKGLEILSLHVPKTGGTSFKAALEEVYPGGVHYDYDRSIVPPESAQVIHGHFPLKRYKQYWGKCEVITWLRDPVDRIVSYYYFWKRTEPHGNPNHDRFLAEKMSLLEFAEFAPVRNELFGEYLEDFDPGNFSFVGIMEQYDRDLVRLAKQMGWSRIPHYQKLNSSQRAVSISPEERARINEIYREERALYDSYADLQ